MPRISAIDQKIKEYEEKCQTGQPIPEGHFKTEKEVKDFKLWCNGVLHGLRTAKELTKRKR